MRALRLQAVALDKSVSQRKSRRASSALDRSPGKIGRTGAHKESEFGISVRAIKPSLVSVMFFCAVLAVGVVFAGDVRAAQLGGEGSASHAEHGEHGLPQSAVEIGRPFGIPVSNSMLVTWMVALGLIAHTEQAWTRQPSTTTSQALVEKLSSKLSFVPASGELPEFTFIRPSYNVNYYRGRWGAPRDETGMFIGRRPQELGREALWGVVQLTH